MKIMHSELIPGPKLPKNFLRLPVVRQSSDFSCGSAVMQSILHYWKAYDGGDDEIKSLLNTNCTTGTHYNAMVDLAHEHGLQAFIKENLLVSELARALAEDFTVVLNIQAWKRAGDAIPWEKSWDYGHYVILVGMDEHYVYLMDPLNAPTYSYLEIPDLLQRWHSHERPGDHTKQHTHLAIYFKGKQKLKGADRELAKTH